MPKRKSCSFPKDEKYINIKKWLDVLEEQLERELILSEKEALYFVSSELDFSDELFDYLMQYCIDLKKAYALYIKAVAISWHNAAIKTPSQAEVFIKKKI